MKLILTALKDALLSYTPARSLIESMMKYDFKIGNPRTQLMQLCFSSLAAWPLILLIGLIFLDPFKGSWSLVRWFGHDSDVVLFLLNGQMSTMWLVFGVAFLLEWLFRKEYIFIGLIFYFVNRSELHIHLALAMVLGVYLSRTMYLWWLSVDARSKTKTIWIWASSLQFAGWVVTSVVSLIMLDYLQVNHLFSQVSQAMVLNRFNFLLLVILGFHLVSHLMLCLWGHFYYKKENDPAELPTYYSTANWILRFNMSYYLQSLLKSTVPAQIEKHSQNVQQMDGLMAEHAGLGALPVGQVLRQELDYLKEANLRLTKI